MRPRWAVLAERALEALIRLSGMSAILFVSAIFFFVFREAAPVLVKDEFSLAQFLFSTEWYPDLGQQRALRDAGADASARSASPALAMLLAVPFGLGAAVYHLRVLRAARARRR